MSHSSLVRIQAARVESAIIEADVSYSTTAVTEYVSVDNRRVFIK